MVTLRAAAEPVIADMISFGSVYLRPALVGLGVAFEKLVVGSDVVRKRQPHCAHASHVPNRKDC